MSNFLKSILGIKKSPKVIKSKMQTRRLELIGLEERINPAITATLTGTVLDITTSAGEDIVSIVAASSGVITINATNAAGGPVSVTAGAGVTVGGGLGTNTLTLVTPGDLTQLSLVGDSTGNQDFTLIGIDSTAYNANFGLSVDMGADTVGPDSLSFTTAGVNLKGSGALATSNIDAITITAGGDIIAATGAVGISATAISTAGDVYTTTGLTTYTGAVTLTGNVTIGNGLTTTGGVNFTSTVNGAFNITTLASGAAPVTFGAVVGGVTPIGALTIASTGAIGFGAAVSAGSLNQTLASPVTPAVAVTLGGNITTTGSQTFTGAVNLTANTTLTSTNGSINLANVNGAQNLTLETPGFTGGTITLTSVGQTTALNTVTVTNSNGVSVGTFSAAKVVLTDTTGTIAFGGSTVITTSLTTAAKAYSVSFAGTSVLSGAPVFLNTGNVSFNGTTSLTTGATITGNAATTVDLAGTIVSGGAFNIGALPLTTTIADGTQLTLNSTTAASTIANFITLTGPATAGTATLSLLGVGTLTLSGDSSTGITTGDSINVINGTLNVTGKIGAASTSTVNGGTLGGTGTLGNVTFNSGTLAPGNSPGTLTTGSIALSPQTTFAVEIGTTSTASDLLIATGGTAGGVTLSNAILSVTSVAAGVKIGDSFTIVNAINTTVISGTFAGLPEGGTITGLDTLGSTVTFRISYPNNQAVQLKVVALVPAPQDAVFTNGTVVATDALKKFTAVGTDAGGGPLVTITFATGRQIQFFAYAESFRGGVRVALGNVDGGTDTELVTGPGAGGGPQVNVWKINVFTGIVTLQSSFFAFSEPSFTGGVYVAAGDTNGNGFDDVIIGAGAGGGPRVQVYAGSANGVVTTSTLNDFFAYSPAFTGGVVVAAGDRNADGDDEIITAPASGGGYNIKSFDGNGTGNSPTVVDNFFAFNNTTSIGGLSLAAGFLNSGNISDLVIGTSNGGYGVIIDFATAGITTVPFAGFTGAIRAGVAEDNIGQDFAVALAGPGGGPILNTYSVISNNLVVNDSLFILDPAFQGGLFGTPTL